MSTITHRETKYCELIRQSLRSLGHATNRELLEHARRMYPEVTATTIHRATARLAERGEIFIAPSDTHGALRYDGNTEPHDHLSCSSCGKLCDIHIKSEILPILHNKMPDCRISGNIIITGICKDCL